MKKTFYVVLLVVFSGMASTNISAGVCSPGLLADIYCMATGDAAGANAADRAHGAVGAPLNQLDPRQQQGRQQPRMGNRCQTRNGVSQPGPWNPVGSYCSWRGTPGNVI